MWGEIKGQDYTNNTSPWSYGTVSPSWKFDGVVEIWLNWNRSLLCSSRLFEWIQFQLFHVLYTLYIWVWWGTPSWLMAWQCPFRGMWMMIIIIIIVKELVGWGWQIEFIVYFRCRQLTRRSATMACQINAKPCPVPVIWETLCACCRCPRSRPECHGERLHRPAALAMATRLLISM